MRIEVSLVPRIPTDSHGRKWDISCKSRSVPGRLRNSPVLGEKLRKWKVHLRILYPFFRGKESGNVIFSWLSASIQPGSCSVSICRVFFYGWLHPQNPGKWHKMTAVDSYHTWIRIIRARFSVPCCSTWGAVVVQSDCHCLREEGHALAMGHVQKCGLQLMFERRKHYMQIGSNWQVQQPGITCDHKQLHANHKKSQGATAAFQDWWMQGSSPMILGSRISW
jgi:hypothetical protein